MSASTQTVPPQAGYTATVSRVLDAKMVLLDGDLPRYLLKAGLAGVLITVLLLANYLVAGLFAASGMPGGAVVGKVLGPAYDRSLLYHPAFTHGCRQAAPEDQQYGDHIGQETEP